MNLLLTIIVLVSLLGLSVLLVVARRKIKADKKEKAMEEAIDEIFKDVLAGDDGSVDDLVCDG